MNHQVTAGHHVERELSIDPDASATGGSDHGEASEQGSSRISWLARSDRRCSRSSRSRGRPRPAAPWTRSLPETNRDPPGARPAL